MTATVTKVTPLPLRNDTILGVCEAIGEDFGFNPLWLRLAFIAPLFVQPLITIGVYLALGAVVAASRHFFPRAHSQTVTDVQPVDRAEADEELQLAA